MISTSASALSYWESGNMSLGSEHPEDEIQPPSIEIRGSIRIVEIDPGLVVAALQAEHPVDIEPGAKAGTVAHTLFGFGRHIFRTAVSPKWVIPTPARGRAVLNVGVRKSIADHAGYSRRVMLLSRI